MRYTYFIILSLFTSLAFSACNSDDDTEDPAPTTEQLLVNGKQWQITDADASFSGIRIYSHADADPCVQDNLIEFKSHQVLIADEGASKCNVDDPQQVTDTWKLSGDTLTLNGATLGLPLTELDLIIEEINSTSMKVSFSDPSFGAPITGNATLKVK